jgi:hypothetical protein
MPMRPRRVQPPVPELQENYDGLDPVEIRRLQTLSRAAHGGIDEFIELILRDGFTRKEPNA